VAAAALRDGKKPTDVIPAPTVLQLPNGGTMRNFNGETCGNGQDHDADPGADHLVPTPRSASSA